MRLGHTQSFSHIRGLDSLAKYELTDGEKWSLIIKSVLYMNKIVLLGPAI